MSKKYIIDCELRYYHNKDNYELIDKSYWSGHHISWKPYRIPNNFVDLPILFSRANGKKFIEKMEVADIKNKDNFEKIYRKIYSLVRVENTEIDNKFRIKI